MSNVIVAPCFSRGIFLPVAVIPAFATAPGLILVGALMTNPRQVKWRNTPMHFLPSSQWCEPLTLALPWVSLGLISFRSSSCGGKIRE